jgi:hypothetical protein
LRGGLVGFDPGLLPAGAGFAGWGSSDETYQRFLPPLWGKVRMGGDDGLGLNPFTPTLPSPIEGEGNCFCRLQADLIEPLGLQPRVCLLSRAEQVPRARAEWMRPRSGMQRAYKCASRLMRAYAARSRAAGPSCYAPARDAQWIYHKLWLQA